MNSICNLCGSKALMLFISQECSNKSCINFRPGLEVPGTTEELWPQFKAGDLVQFTRIDELMVFLYGSRETKISINDVLRREHILKNLQVVLKVHRVDVEGHSISLTGELVQRVCLLYQSPDQVVKSHNISGCFIYNFWLKKVG